MKIFNEEIVKFYQKLTSNRHFAFSKYADGEWSAIKREYSTPGNGEWIISPETERSCELLTKSFKYQDPGYYVGISCPCCQGANHYAMIDFSGQLTSQLTFANLFVNANYNFYLEKFIPEFSNKEIILVANRNSDITKLPFKVEEFYGVGYNAWVDDLNIIQHIIQQNYYDKLLLFSCGPLGNILCHQLWSSNKNNTYLDVGSTLDIWLNNDFKNKRCYAIGISEFSEKQCIWGDR